MLHMDSTFNVSYIELLQRAQLGEPLQRKPGDLLGVIIVDLFIVQVW